MPLSSRIKAFFAYLFLAVGALLVLLFSRKDRFAVYHARQSIVITVVAIAAPVVWAVPAYLVAFIPFVGPILAAASFTLVIAAFIALFVAWVSGLVYALQAAPKPVPFFGDLAKRWMGNK